MIDPHAQHPGVARLRLRPALRFVPQAGSRPWCLLEDTTRSKFFRIGWNEYTFISLLDGSVTIDEAISTLARQSPESELSTEDGVAICRWLLQEQLAETEASRAHGSMPDNRQTAWSLTRLVSFKVPLCRPDRHLQTVATGLGWLFSVPCVAVWLLCCVVAGWQIGERWDEFWATSSLILAPSNWGLLAACWLTLKVIHELGHAVACKRYGGTVREAGLFFIFFAPLAYVDVTSAWGFRRRRSRVFTSTAGIYFELWSACLAAFVWIYTPSSWAGQFAFNTVLAAGAGAILFNANPLMRFDGYYVLSDVCGLPNLYALGQQYVRYLVQRFLLGAPVVSPLRPSGTPWWVGGYGILAVAWKTTVCIGLVVAASTLFHGAGLLLAFAAAVGWLAGPLVNLMAIFRERSVSAKRCVVVASCLTVLVIVAWLKLPAYSSTAAPAHVSYAPLTSVRSESSGFVSEVFVSDGDLVEDGDLLMRLSNPELQLELQDLRLQTERSRVKIRQYERQFALSAQQVEKRKLASLQDRLEELRGRVDGLTLRAVSSGRVLNPQLQTLLGTYVTEGQEVVSIGEESRKELRVSIGQQDIDRFAVQCGAPVDIWLPGLARLTSRLSEVEPSATRQIEEMSLAAVEGGPIPVTRAETSDAATEYEFIEPRFVGRVKLNPRQSRALRAGQIGFVKFVPLGETAGDQVARSFTRYFRHLLTRSQ